MYICNSTCTRRCSRICYNMMVLYTVYVYLYCRSLSAPALQLQCTFSDFKVTRVGQYFVMIRMHGIVQNPPPPFPHVKGNRYHITPPPSLPLKTSINYQTLFFAWDNSLLINSIVKNKTPLIVTAPVGECSEFVDDLQPFTRILDPWKAI